MPLQPTDVPSRAGIQAAIDEAVDNHADEAVPGDPHYDSGWIAVPLTAGWGGSLSIRRIGSICYLRGQIDNGPSSTTVPVSSGTTIATAPAGFRPSFQSHVFTPATQNPSSVPSRLFVNTSGTLSLYTYNAAIDYVSVMTSYLVD